MCYRNSVLHSIFSIDYFMNLLESGKSVTQNAQPMYGQLFKAAQHFRGGKEEIFRGNVERAWMNITQRYPRAVDTIDDRDTVGSAQSRFALVDGEQHDVSEFYAHLVPRLCVTELFPEELL